MLTFFRRIRKGLLGDGATSKYLIYAIGEIALVVIGILIALQINNWNEWRKDRIKERVILNDLQESIQRSIEQMNLTLDKLDDFERSHDLILHNITSELPYSDSMDLHFYQNARLGGYQFIISKDGYESLKNAGFDIITNETLKDNLLYLFEQSVPYVENQVKFVIDQHFEFENIRDTFFYYGIRSLKPKNYNGLLNNPEFLSFLSKASDIRSYFKATLEICLLESQSVIQLIKEELGKSE